MSTEGDPLAHDVAALALADYPLPAGARIHPVSLSNNAVFDVTADETAHRPSRYVLRVHRPLWRTPEQTRAELRFLRLVATRIEHTAVTVPLPVPTRDGDLVATVRTPTGMERHCSLVTWVDGVVRRPGSGLGPGAARLLGAALARIHLAGEQVAVTAEPALPRWDSAGLFSDTSPYLSDVANYTGMDTVRTLLDPADRAVFEEVSDRTTALLTELGEGESGHAEHGLIHNDFILGNCHFERQRTGWRIAVLDFDECGWGWFRYDLGTVLGNLADYPATYPRLSREFRTGYRAIREMPAYHEQHLPLMMAARHIAQCLWAVGRVLAGANDPEWAERHLRVRTNLARYCLGYATRPTAR